MIDYRPDLPPTDPSLLQACSHAIPDRAGQYRTSFAASAVTNWSTAFNSACLGARMVKKADGTPFLFAGCAARIEEWNGATLTNVSKGGGSPYSATSANRWWFEQFGDETLACNGADTTQTRSGAAGSAFADHATAPKAKIIIAQSNHVLALNYNDGSAVPHGIKWASEGSTATWTAAAGNTAGNAKLIESPGAITAGAAIHDVVSVWKLNSMYIGKRIGGTGTTIWQFNMLSNKIGCPHMEAWVSTPVGIIFASTNNGIFRFDGSMPAPIDQGIRNEIYRTLGSSIMCSHDEASACVFFWVPNATIAYAYNYISNKWSKAYASSIGNASFTTFTTPVRDANYDDAASLGATPNALTRRVHMVVTAEKKIVNLDGTTPANGLSPSFSSQTVRDPKADPRDETLIQRVMPIFGYDPEAQAFREPTAGTLTYTPRGRLAGGAFAAQTATLDSAKGFDITATANSFAMQFDFTNEALVLADLAYETKFAGKR